MATAKKQLELAQRALDEHQREYGVPVPASLRRLWSEGVPFAHDGKVYAPTRELPHFGSGTVRLRVTAPSWARQARLGGLDAGVVGVGGSWAGAARFLPLFHAEQSRLVVVRLDAPGLPVGWFDEESLGERAEGFHHGIFQLAPKLTEFLSHLEDAVTAQVETEPHREVWSALPEKKLGRESKASEAAVDAGVAAPRGKPQRVPPGDFVVWTSDWAGFGVERANGPAEDYHGFRRGTPLLESWSSRRTLKVYSDWRDAPPTPDDYHARDGLKVGSKRLVDFLKSKELKGVEYLPVKVVDQRGKPLPVEYFIIHCVDHQDALDLEASGAKMSTIRKVAVDRVKKIVVAPQRVAEGVRLFRLREFSRHLLLEQALAQELARQGLTGLKFEATNKSWD